jgi:predicted ABC-type transport system involved in lysophospholipase L1 biosynthesis ATPase subunit
MSAEKSGFDSGEERLINWAGWKNGLQPVDESDAKMVDKVINTLSAEVRAAVRAVYVEFPRQSIYFVSAELAVPPTFINRSLKEAKDAIGG